MADFLKPHLISVRRPNVNNTPGKQPYSGVLPTNETVIVASVKAHIEEYGTGRPSPSGLPADSQGEPDYTIIFNLPQNTVQTRDIIVDLSNGNRFQVILPDWGSLCTSCYCKKLEN